MLYAESSPRHPGSAGVTRFQMLALHAQQVKAGSHTLLRSAAITQHPGQISHDNSRSGLTQMSGLLQCSCEVKLTVGRLHPVGNVLLQPLDCWGHRGTGAPILAILAAGVLATEGCQWVSMKHRRPCEEGTSMMCGQAMCSCLS